ncbi:MAG: DAK2 domain-containing protein, partial [Lachnospiraceae bacterium]|nr:DAK2 domain-containing protein [Lachnospiraceae bacterium]
KPDMKAVSKAISKGSLKGARGNSGVIMSQLLRGFTKVAQGYQELTIPEICEGLERAVETAYKAVMKPKEGTILTVARGVAEKAVQIKEEKHTIDEFLNLLIIHGDEVLEHTPDLLPVLKEAGVVDSGGQGLMVFLKGIHNAMLGIAPAEEEPVVPEEPKKETKPVEKKTEFLYCVEFVINLKEPAEHKELVHIKNYLEARGKSVVMAADESTIGIHIHTDDPGKVIQKGLSYGELTSIKVDNRNVEHTERLGFGGAALEGADVVWRSATQKPAPPAAAKTHEAGANDIVEDRKPYGFIAVAAGDGFNTIFKEMNADVVISGGQTMNPSTDDFLKAIKGVSADTIFVLPDNSNIIMAAKQAAEMTKDKKIIVIPTKTVTQGISAMISFAPEMSPEDNEAAILEAIKMVRTASVTYAVRDTSIDGIEIHEGDIMAVGDGGILAVGSGITEVACESVRKMIDEESGLVSIYYGEGYTEEQAGELAGKLADSGVECEFEIQNGGQPVYYCIISVE